MRAIKCFKCLFCFLLFLSGAYCFSQDKLEDQLYKEYIEAYKLLENYNLTQSLSKLDSIYDIAKAKNLEYIIGRVNNGYGLIFSRIGEYNNASESYSKALEIDLRIKADSAQIIRDYGNLLYCYTQTKEHDKFDSIIPIAFSYVTQKNAISNHVLEVSS